MCFNLRILKSVEKSASAGAIILVIATLLSGMATARMMYLGSPSDHWLVRAGKTVLGLGLVEGGLAFAYHGIRHVFTNGIQRFIALVFLVALVCAILCNL